MVDKGREARGDSPFTIVTLPNVGSDNRCEGCGKQPNREGNCPCSNGAPWTQRPPGSHRQSKTERT